MNKRAKRLVNKMLYQKKYWSDINSLSQTFPSLNKEAFPKSPENVLGVIDLYDVPFGEKIKFKTTIEQKFDGSPNIIYFNAGERQENPIFQNVHQNQKSEN